MVHIFYIIKTMFVQKSLQILKDNHQKNTKTRLWILEQLANIEKPLNPYALIQASISNKINISTIYRNLELFESLGIVHKIHSLWWYMPCIHQHTHCNKVHDLIICNSCNSIHETHIDPNTKKLLWLSAWPVELSGHCESCEQKK